jgi:hypothetical protein
LEWRDAVGFPGYMISDNGDVLSIKSGKQKIMRTFFSEKGYKRVGLMLGDKQKGVFVHRLVATAFIGEIKEGFTVNHKNGDKADSRLSNLEIVSQSYNTKHSNYVLNNAVTPVKCLELGTNFELAEFKSIAAASVITGIDEGAIHKCCNGKRNKAGNFKWSFAKADEGVSY